MSKKILGFTFLLASIASSTGCMSQAGAETSPEGPMVTTIASGNNTVTGLAPTRKIEVYRDQVTFNGSLYEFIQPMAEETIDFTLNQVVLLSLGEKSSGGYSVSVSGVEETDDYVRVFVSYTFPGSNCMVPTVITSPFLFVNIDTVKELVFEERIQSVSCS